MVETFLTFSRIFSRCRTRVLVKHMFFFAFTEGFYAVQLAMKKVGDEAKILFERGKEKSRENPGVCVRIERERERRECVCGVCVCVKSASESERERSK